MNTSAAWDECVERTLDNAHWIIKVYEKGDKLQFCPFEHFVYENNQTKDVAHGTFDESILRICQKPIRLMVQWVQDYRGISLSLHKILIPETTFRGYLPLDERAGACLSLFSELCTGHMRPEMLQLMAWRISNMQYEEATYLLGKATLPALGNERTKGWAKKGLRIMLGGTSSDIDEIRTILSRYD